MADNQTAPDTAPFFYVSVTDFIALMLIWILYCCMGPWSTDQPLRILSLLHGGLKIVLYNVWLDKRDLAVSLFSTYIAGRFRVDATCAGLAKGAALLIWMGLDIAAIFFSPLMWVSLIYEGILVVCLLMHLIRLTAALQERGRGRWLIRTCAISLWALMWGILSVLYYFDLIHQIVMIIWLMSYAACFPKPLSAASPGPSPQPVPRSSWLRMMAGKRSG